MLLLKVFDVSVCRIGGYCKRAVSLKIFLQKYMENFIAGWRIFYIFAAEFLKKVFIMTGNTAKRNSVSVPKTANSCGQALSAAIRRVIKSGDNPLAAIPETVIIGDRGLTP